MLITSRAAAHRTSGSAYRGSSAGSDLACACGPATRLSEAEPARQPRVIRVQHHPVHAVIAAREQVPVPSRQVIGHPPTVGPASRLTSAGLPQRVSPSGRVPGERSLRRAQQGSIRSASQHHCPGRAVIPVTGAPQAKNVTNIAAGKGLLGPDGLAVRGLAGSPALGQPGDKEQAASAFVEGEGPAEVRGGAAAVRDLADERPVPDETELDRALGVPDRVGYQFADYKPGGERHIMKSPAGEPFGHLPAGVGDDGRVGRQVHVATWLLSRARVRAMSRATSSAGRSGRTAFRTLLQVVSSDRS